MEELRRLHEEYRVAVARLRDEGNSPEAHAALQADVLEKRHALDAALIDKQQETEDEARLSAIEARQAAARTVGNIVVPTTPAIPVDQIRAYAQGRERGANFSFTIPLGGQISQINAADMTTTDTTTYSSYTVPQTWANEVYRSLVEQSGVLAAGPRIINTASGNKINFPKLTTAPTGAAGTEGVAATETNPVFGTVPLDSYRVDGWIPVTDELLRDSGVDMAGLIRDMAADALAVKAAPYYGDIDIGTGSSLPAAITVGITNGKTAAAVDSVTLNEAKQLMMSVGPAYRKQGKFIANTDVFTEFMLAQDDNGNYMWQPSNVVDDPDRLWGKPIFEDTYFDASATGNIPLVYGDIGRAYLVRRIGGIQVDFSRDFAFTSFETTVRFALWHDAALLDLSAIRACTLA